MPKLQFPRGDDRSRVFELVLAVLVVSFNLKRRNLNEGQRSMVAARLANMRVGDNQYSEGTPMGRASIEKAAHQLNVSEGVHAHGRSRDLSSSGAGGAGGRN